MGQLPLTLAPDIITTLVIHEIAVSGFHGREMFATWYKVSTAVANRRIDLSPIITHRLPLEEYERGFKLAKAGRAGKVILHP